MVHGIVACDIGRHVRQYHIHLASDHLQELDHGVVVGYVSDDELDAVDGMDIPEVDAYDLTGLADALPGHLGPPSRTCPQIHYGIPVVEDVETVVDLHDLIGRPGTISFLLSELVIIFTVTLGHPTVMQVCHVTLNQVHRYECKPRARASK